MVRPLGNWMCLEFMIDQAQGLISTWIEGNLIAGLVAAATPRLTLIARGGAAYGPKLTSFTSDARTTAPER
jgi:hypothetical protein